MATIYQIVNAQNGQRSEPFSAPDNLAMATALSAAAEKNPGLRDDFVLVLIENAPENPVASRAPLMLVSTVIGIAHVATEAN